MTNLRNPTALITGASSGIGLEIAKCAIVDGYDLIIVARAEVKLNHAEKELREHYNGNVAAIAADLSQPGAAEKVYKQATAKGRQIDVLVNNAGFGDYGAFAAMDPVTMREMLAVNISMPTELTRLALTDMVKRGDGKILNVASTAAFQPGPFMAEYYATKAYVLSLSEALHEELKGTGVTVTTLAPGPTSTNFEKRGHIKESRLFHGDRTMHARDVAVAGWVGLLAGRRLVVPGLQNRVGTFLVRFVPRAQILRMVKRMQGPRT